MDLNASESYEFLDLSEVDDTERKEIIETLYTTPAAAVVAAAPPIHDTLQNADAIRCTNNSTTTTRTRTTQILEGSKTPNTGNSQTSTNFDSPAYGSNVFHIVAKPLLRGDAAATSSKHNSSRNVATFNNNGYIQPTTTTTTTHLISKSEKPPQIGHVVRNVMIPRLITPIPFPFCAIVKQPTTLTEVAVVPLRAPILTASAAAVKIHAEQSKTKVIVNAGGPKASSTGLVQNTTQPTMHVQQPPPPQQQQQQPQQPVQQQQQIVTGSVQPGPAVQQVTSQQNNIASYAPHHHVGPAYTAMPQGGMYMPAHGVQQVGPAMYPAMIPAGLPGNVYHVNNVTANVNLHGWSPHPMQTFIPGGAQQYMHGDVPQAIQTSADQNAVMQPVQSVAVPMNRTPRRGRGRGGNNGTRRNDYVQRQQQDSPAPQEVINAQVDPQSMGAAYSQYGYQYGYSAFFPGPPQNMVHPQAQQAAGQPIYVTGPMPMYHNPHMYNYHPSGILYPSMMQQAEYQVVDENGEERTINEPMMQQMWHPQMYTTEGYVNAEMMPGDGGDDMNHNPSPMASVDTPSMLSPNYPMYDQQMQQTIELQQHVNAMHIYEHMPPQQPNMHQQQLMHSNEDDLSECSQQLQQEQMQQLEQDQMQMHHDPHAPQYIMAGPGMIPIENQLDQSGSDQSTLENLLNNSNEMVMPIEVPSVVNNNVIVPIPNQSNLANFIHQQQPPPRSQPAYDNTTMPSVVVANKEANIIHDYNQNVPNAQTAHNQQIDVVELAAGNVLVEAYLPPPAAPILTSASTSTEHLILDESTNTNNNNKRANLQPHNNEIPNVPANISLSNGTIVQTIITKSMSWTSSHTKKSTASVAVTATPTPANKSSPNVQRPAGVVKSHHQSQQHNQKPPPPSPVAERRMSQQHEPKQAVSTTSIASTVVPQQFAPPPPHHQVQDNKPMVIKQTHPVPPPAAAAAAAADPKPEVKVRKEETLNLAPPPTTAAPTAAPAPFSWASLFVSSNATNFTTSPSSSTTNTTAPPLPTVKRPIAKIAPFDGVNATNATQNVPPIVTPGALSYSAASAQGIPPPTSQQQQQQQQSVQSAASKTTTTLPNVDEWSLKYAEFLTKFKPDFANVSLRPRGLTNRSNWCYINSILQALIGCPPFYNLLRAIPKQSAAIETDIKTPTINAMVQFASEFSHLPPGSRLNFNRREKVQKGGKDDIGGELQCDSAFEPNAIYKLWNASRSDVERQEDAEEFLGYVLNKLNDEMLEAIKLIAKPNPQENGDSNVEPDDGDDWQMIYSNKGNKGSVLRQTDFGKSPLSDIFRGELRSRLQREGGHSTDVIQPFFTLQLNIEKAASVKEALDILVGRDQLEGVTCSKTNQEVVAWQQITLEKLPVVLILHLKWFDYKSDGCTKILKTVEFPVELKIDTKILASKKYFQKQRMYRLFAVVYHDGKEASKGHYITDVFHPGYSSWLRYDDSSVKPVSENNVLRPRVPRVPYLLYYRRCDTVAGSTTSTQSSQPQQQQQQQQNTTHK